MRVNIFKSVKGSSPEEVELDGIVDMMRTDQDVHMKTILYRKLRESGATEIAEQMKTTRFPSFAPSAVLYGGKGRKYALGLTDLCYLDFDNVEDEKLMIDTMNILRNDKNVFMASKSISNKGIHILVRYQLDDIDFTPQHTSLTPNEMQDIYGKLYKYFAERYKEKLGIMPDYNAAHMERVYIISYDPELYYNPDANPFVIKSKILEQ